MDFAALRDSESRPSSSPLPAEPEDEGKPKELDPELLATPRGQKVKAAVDLWKSQLIDIGGRNNLLYYRDLTRGTLDLEQADPAAVRRLLEGKSSVALSRMFTDRADLEAAVRRARTISKKAREHFEERGIDTLSLACGMATWENTIGTSMPAAPILLRGAQLVPRGAAQDDFDVVLSGEMDVNPTLLHFLESQFDCTFDLDALYARMDGAIDTPEELESAYAWMQEHGKRVPSFAVRSRLILGTFSYAKLPMVKDLENALGELIKHDVIAAIAGDGDAREALRGIAGTVGEQLSVADPNHVPLADEFLILDADSSQNYAINFVLHGGNVIVKGPPGTGKSQTISNLIASLVARGKRVLFVAEKRAAIDAVLKRLDGKGLGDLVLDLHGGRSRKEVAETLERALDLAGSTPLVDRTSELKKLEARRAELRDYADALHAEREPWGVSVFDAQAELLGIEADVETDVRWSGEPLRRIDVATAEQASEDLRSYVGRGGLTLKASPSPWAQAEIAAPDEAGRALTLAQRLAKDVVPSTLARLETAAQETGLTPPSVVAGWRDALEMWREVAKIFDTFSPEVFSLELEQVTAALEPAATGGFARFRASLFSGAYKEARSTLRSLARTESISDGDLYASVVTALERRCFWDEAASTGALPTVPSALEDLAQAYFGMCQELDTLSKLVGPEELLAQRERDDLLRHLNALVGDRQTLYKIPELRRLEKSLDDIGLRDLVEGMRSRSLDEEECVRCFGHAWLSSILEDVQLADPRIGAFDGLHHSRLVEEYRTGDSRHIETTAQRIKRAYAEHAIAARNSFPAEAEKVRAQAKRKRGHRPTRTLFREAPNALLALKPCWAMSPLLVSQTLPARTLFDVVIFDEASQITPADAVPAILRGERVVVAGDDKQLPPTSFFMTSVPEEEEDEEELLLEAATHGYESILDVLDVFLPSRMLTWHYRSQCERLIAFSNGHFYGRGLTTFPGALGDGCVGHVLVRFRVGEAGQEQSVSDEVVRVVELIVEHARERPDETLGVIAMGINHANRIDEALRKALRDDGVGLEEFFSDDRDERFFIKNLERVQGDERDAIILSVGYGKTADGRLLYRFGPLNVQGGERRLNVAVTRAKKRMTLVSSFDHTDLDPSRSSAEGVAVLRQYLEYAASGGRNLGEAALEDRALNAFELDVQTSLSRAGIPLEAQWGASGYRIDFVAKHPERPGRFVLAIECDGASYHSTPTARDRDRLRQEQLQRLGWKFHRIWSTEWFHNREQVVGQTVERYKRAVEEADAEDAAPQDQQPQKDDGEADGGGAGAKTWPTTPPRGPRPNVPPGRDISEYARAELVSVVRWIESDTLLRSDEEMMRLVMHELGFQKAGSRIKSAILNAIKSAHRGHS